MSQKKDKAARGTLRAALATAGGTRVPSVEEFLEHFMEVAGGARALATHLHAEFVAARPGSVIRARVLELIVRSLKFADESKRGPEDLGLLTEADLERLVAERETRAGEAADAQPPAP